jgi:hypothetical protein
VSDEYPPTERLSTFEGVPSAGPGRPGRRAQIALIALGVVLLVAVAVGTTVLLMTGRPGSDAAGSPTPTIPSPSFSAPPSPSATPMTVTEAPPEDEEEEEEEEEDDVPAPPAAPPDAIESIVVSVFDGDGMTPEEICGYDPWETANSAYHDDKFNLAVNWSSNGTIDRMDLTTTDGSSWWGMDAEDVIFTPFECWNGPSGAHQVQITLTAFAAGTAVDTAVVIVRANEPVQITY